MDIISAICYNESTKQVIDTKKGEQHDRHFWIAEGETR